MEERIPRDEEGAEQGEPSPSDEDKNEDGESSSSDEDKNEAGESSSEDKNEAGEPAAPSIGAKTEIEHVPPQERLAGVEHSSTDAMGLDKRREVMGQTYGPTRQRVILSFVVFFAIVAAVFIGLLFLVGQLDQPPDSNPDQAPWSAPDVQQGPPNGLQ